jgi:inorganic pyrophosphatase
MIRVLFFFIFFIFNFNSHSNEISNQVTRVDKFKIVGKKNFLFDYKNFITPLTVNVVIEIPKNTNEKWEVSKLDGSLEHEFFMGVPRIINHLPYPINYGMIPRTVLPLQLGGDGDPVDAIVLGDALPRGEVVEAKVLGLIKMRDMGEVDDKVITVNKDSDYFKFNSIEEFQENNPKIMKNIIAWFQNYKGNNLVEIEGVVSNIEAIGLIEFASKSFDKYGVRPR